MQKGFLRSYSKTVCRGVARYLRNYVKEIINELNVKSFKKYRYNFLCEFIGSFVFVFFISIYMLNSNYNDDYVIEHSKQINPYRASELFQSEGAPFEHGLKDLLNFSDPDAQDGAYPQAYLGSVLLQTELVGTAGEAASNPDEVDRERAAEVTTDAVAEVAAEVAAETTEVTTESATETTATTETTAITTDPSTISISSIVDSLSEPEPKEPVITEVENVIFKNPVNEYSKIKISDIDHIDLENIDEYETLANSKSKVTKHHSIYTILGCLLYVVFVILGAHINPAYTYALWLLEPKKYGFLLSTFYVSFQYAGGILASVLVAHMYGSIFIYSLIPQKQVLRTFCCETLCTFILTIALINLYQYKKRFARQTKSDDRGLFEQITQVADSRNAFEDFGGYDNYQGANRSKGWVRMHVENKYVKYIIYHIFFFTFIFFAHLLFIFVSNTSLNPIFSTSTLYTYLYFKLFRTSGALNVLAIAKSFLSIQRLWQMFLMYVCSLPFWAGPYVGSTFGSMCMQQLENTEEEDEEEEGGCETTGGAPYEAHKKKEKKPLLGKFQFKQNVYMVDYSEQVNRNVQRYVAPILL